jgi:lipoprotein NlpI
MAWTWFDATDAEAFGLKLAKYYMDRIPAAAVIEGKRSLGKHDQVVAGMFQLRDHFKATHKLNIYKKAKMANTFKWALRENGYPDALSNKLTLDVVMRL